jgi:glycerol-3-phosphate acyltransferase PlsY
VVAAVAAPLAVAALGRPPAVVAAAIAMSVVIVLRHRENFARLRAGTEPRFGLHKRQAPHGK